MNDDKPFAPKPRSTAREGGDEGVTLETLSKEAGVSGRTVRFYIINGLIDPPTGAGPAARYPTGHIARLKLVRALQEEGMQLAKIAAVLASASDEEVAWQLKRLPPPSVRHEPVTSSRTPFLPGFAEKREGSFGPRRSQWEHYVLEPGVELHVRRPLTLIANKRVRALLEELLAGESGPDDEPR